MYLEKPGQSTSASSMTDASEQPPESESFPKTHPTFSSHGGTLTAQGNSDDDLDLLTVENAWDKCNLLTLDGGGIRGLWSLLALDKLMSFIADCEQKQNPNVDSSFHPEAWQEFASQVPLKKDEKGAAARPNPSRRFLPCHYFDMIGGSSTGSLIAIMLGRLRMTTLDCLYEYESLGQRVFGKPRLFWLLTLPFTKRTKYSARKVQKVFKEVATRRGDQRVDVMTFKSKTRTCKTFVTTIANKPGEDSLTTHLIRSYDSYGPVLHKSNEAMGRLTNRGPAHELEICKVARAATAAKFYFDPLEIEHGRDKGIKFTDGGFGKANNPTMEGIHEILEVEGNGKIGCVVSVGTARHNLAEEREKSFIRYRLRSMVNEITDPKIIHDEVEHLSKHGGFSYYRLNPEKPEHQLKMGFDEWSGKFGDSPGSATISEIKDTFAKWYNEEVGIARMFMDCAEELVRIRTLRSQSTERWERFSLASEYVCRKMNCHKQGTGFSRMDEYKRHLADVHHLDVTDLDEEVAFTRSIFEYNSDPDEAERKGKQ